MPITSMTDFDFYLLPYPLFTGRKWTFLPLCYTILTWLRKVRDRRTFHRVWVASCCKYIFFF